MMKENLSMFFTISGLVGMMFFGYQFYQETVYFQIPATDIHISTGDYTPIIVSGVIMLTGILLSRLNIR